MSVFVNSVNSMGKEVILAFIMYWKKPIYYIEQISRTSEKTCSFLFERVIFCPPKKRKIEKPENILGVGGNTMKKEMGLTDEEVCQSRKQYGSNEIGNYKQNSFLHLVLQSLGDPIIRILLIA